jgi:hypothetical protein
MAWAWVVAFLGFLVLVGLGVYFWNRLSLSSSHPTADGRGSQPYNPSVFVDMDDKPPMEIDFDAGIKANQRILSKNPGKDEPS